jgi:tRNA (guanine37-N1)-methyltransferase
MNEKVPDILLSGNHAKIERWRREQSIIRTIERRPDLMNRANLTKEDMKFIKTLDK